MENQINEKILILKDNTNYENYICDNDLIKTLKNKSVFDLYNNKFIIFPSKIEDTKDLEKGNYIFETCGNGFKTCNIVGFISEGKNKIIINSRFKNNKDDENDYFLIYMINKVLNCNITTSNTDFFKGSDAYKSILMLLFPYYLNKAISKGYYKEYVRREYNNQNIKGTIDISRHIKYNVPFTGKIAYNTREFNLDNIVNKLIRCTIEKIEKNNKDILTSNKETIENIKRIKKITNPSNIKHNIVNENIYKPVTNTHFKEYLELQNICIKILKGENKYRESKDKFNGIIINIAWLWEEYIHKVTKWKHYTKSGYSLKMFEENGQVNRYPDFTIEDKIPIDTKFKENIDCQNDYNQIITYMYLLKAEKGGFLKPICKKDEKNSYKKIGTITGFGGEMFEYNFQIPEKDNYEDFQKEMLENEKRLKEFKF